MRILQRRVFADRSRNWLIVVGIGLLLAPAASARGAGGNDPAADRKEFDDTYQRLIEVIEQAKDLRDRYRYAPDDKKKKEIEDKFTDLIRLGSNLRRKVKVLGEKVYLENPSDTDMAKNVLGSVASCTSADEYEDALRMSKELIDNKFTEPDVYYFAVNAALQVCDFKEVDRDLDAAIEGLGKAAAEGKRSPEQRQMYQQMQQQMQNIKKVVPDLREKWDREQKIRAQEAKDDDLPRVKLVIGDSDGKEKGVIVVELFENEAPNTVANFISLVEKGFYDGLTFHRVIQSFMAQGGNPKGDGSGGPDYTIADECNKPNHRDHFRGSLSMAHSSEPNSNGSQFFITFVPTSHLDGVHTVFGRVVKGMGVLGLLQRINPEQPGNWKADKIISATVVRKRDHAYSPKKIPAAKP